MCTSVPPPRRRRYGCLLAVSLLLNLALAAAALWPAPEEDGPEVTETHLYGPRRAADKVAVAAMMAARIESDMVFLSGVTVAREGEPGSRRPRDRR